MNTYPIIAISIGLLLILLLAAVFVVYRRKGELPEPNYRLFFILGMTWLPLGIAMDNPGLWGMGTVFMVLGLANKEKWHEPVGWSKSTLTARSGWLLVMLGLVLLAALVLGLALLNRGQ